MSTLFDIIEKLQATQTAIRETQKFVTKHPQDYGTMANFESLNKRAMILEEAFIAKASAEQCDICTYRMFAEESKNYPILNIGAALQDLQNWFSTVYDALKNGPKQRARLSPEIIKQSTLDFAFTFTGSVGFALTIPSERVMFDNVLHDTIRKTIQMAKFPTSDDIHHLVGEVGIASIRAMYNWVKNHTVSNTGAEIKWLKDEKEFISAFFTIPHLIDLRRAIEETSDKTEVIFEVVGILVGADINKHIFHLAFEENPEIKGTMEDTVGFEYTVELPKKYLAVLRKTSYVNYATEEEYTKYHLLKLKESS